MHGTVSQRHAHAPEGDFADDAGGGGHVRRLLKTGAPMPPLEELVQELQTLIKKSEQPVYSVDEAAAILECTRESVEAHLRAGRLPGLKFGRSWVLPVQAFVQHLNEQAVSEAAEKREGGTKRRRETLAAAALQLPVRPSRRRRPPPSLDGPYIVLGDLKG